MRRVLAAAILLSVGLGACKSHAPEYKKVLTARESIAKGEVIKKDMLTVRAVLSKRALKGAFVLETERDIRPVLGRIAKKPIPKGAQITEMDLAQSPPVDAAKRSGGSS